MWRVLFASTFVEGRVKDEREEREVELLRSLNRGLSQPKEHRIVRRFKKASWASVWPY